MDPAASCACSELIAAVPRAVAGVRTGRATQPAGPRRVARLRRGRQRRVKTLAAARAAAAGARPGIQHAMRIRVLYVLRGRGGGCGPARARCSTPARSSAAGLRPARRTGAQHLSFVRRQRDRGRSWQQRRELARARCALRRDHEQPGVAVRGVRLLLLRQRARHAARVAGRSPQLAARYPGWKERLRASKACTRSCAASPAARWHSSRDQTRRGRDPGLLAARPVRSAQRRRSHRDRRRTGARCSRCTLLRAAGRARAGAVASGDAVSRRAHDSSAEIERAEARRRVGHADVRAVRGARAHRDRHGRSQRRSGATSASSARPTAAARRGCARATSSSAWPRGAR